MATVGIGFLPGLFVSKHYKIHFEMYAFHLNAPKYLNCYKLKIEIGKKLVKSFSNLTISIGIIPPI